MKKHKFTDEEHFAIWRAYGQKCFYCEQPLAFAEITIDHQGVTVFGCVVRRKNATSGTTGKSLSTRRGTL